MGAMRKATFLAVLMMISGLAGCFGADEDEDTDEIVAVFTYSPATNIRAGQTIDFDARDSLPSGVALTYKWDFDGDNSIDATGRTADWAYPEVGEYTVELIVSDGSKSQSTTKTLTIVDATALPPTAEITSYSSEEDCEGEDVDTGSYIHVWACDLDKSNTDRTAGSDVSVELDASDSTSGSSDDYVSMYHWDLDIEYDADGDGDPTNDNDLEGETV
ncbi:MAG TPA: PKD domain-containing protein, partial [Candidatus Poseidoniales archaeon]